MIVVLCHDSALQGYTGTIWANEMNCVLNHILGAESNVRPHNQQSSANMVRTPPDDAEILTKNILKTFGREIYIVLTQY